MREPERDRATPILSGEGFRVPAGETYFNAVARLPDTADVQRDASAAGSVTSPYGIGPLASGPGPAPT
jgi:hypothetical protein